MSSLLNDGMLEHLDQICDPIMDLGKMGYVVEGMSRKRICRGFSGEAPPVAPFLLKRTHHVAW